MTFRFDDVCMWSDMQTHNQMADYLRKEFPECKIIWAYSPLVHSSQHRTGRVYPKRWNALSDYREFYKLDLSGFNILVRKDIELASHGLVHCDHRLLSRGAQEMSILVSNSLIVYSKKFVPPFNKWNKDTEDICNENGIELIKFEDGWKSMEYNTWDAECNLWYLHAREWTMETFKSWFDK